MALIWRVRAIGNGIQGAPFYQNFYYAQTTGSASDAKSAVGNFFNESKAEFSAALSWQIQSDVAQIESETGDIISVTSLGSETIQGSKAGEPLPFASQGLLQLRTGVYVGGRELRGRCFLPGFTEGQSAGGKPDNPLVTFFQGTANQYLKGTAQDVSLVVWSRTTGEIAPVANIFMWREWAVLRSRRN